MGQQTRRQRQEEYIIDFSKFAGGGKETAQYRCAYDCPVREMFEGITDEQWFGNEPYRGGSEYFVNEGLVRSECYECWFGGGDVVGGTVVKADIKFSNETSTISFWLYGVTNPHVRCMITPKSAGGKVIGFDSWEHSPILFDKHFAKYLNETPFKSKFGRMTISAMADALEYRAFWANKGVAPEGSR